MSPAEDVKGIILNVFFFLTTVIPSLVELISDQYVLVIWFVRVSMKGVNMTVLQIADKTEGPIRVQSKQT